MVWTRKSGAPATFDLGEAFVALITGDTTWSWLVKYVPLIGELRYNTDDFCANGPSGTDPLSASDFYTSNRNWLAQLANDILLAVKVRNAAYDRVFGAYCEQFTGSTAGCVDNDWHMDPNNGQWGWCTPRAGTTSVKIRGGTGGNLVEIHTCATVDNINSAVYSPQWQTSSSGSDIDIPWPGPYPNPHLATRVNAWRPTLQPQDCGLFGSDSYTPAPQPLPTGVLPPTSKTYATIPDLGAELDAQELKLDFITKVVQYLAQTIVPPDHIPDDPITPEPDTAVPLKGAVGVIITVSSIPAGSSESFGTPAKYHRLGRVTLGTDLGWFAPVDLEETPMVIAPLPPGTTQVKVVCWPPATATVTVLRPPK